MTVRRTAFAIAAAALLSAGAGVAHAADKNRPIDFTVKSEPVAAIPNAGKNTFLDASKGRFGVTLKLQTPDVRPQTLNDVQAGAYFRITPSLRVGGSVALGQEVDPRTARRFSATPARPTDPPKVKLETAFKF